MRETDGINLYVFIMVLCCAITLRFYLSATRCFGGVYWHPFPNSIHPGHTNKTLMKP